MNETANEPIIRLLKIAPIDITEFDRAEIFNTDCAFS